MRRALLALFVAGAGLLVVGAPASAEPEATIDEQLVARGSTLVVRGTDWEPGALLTVEICGNNALDRSADCDQRNSISVGVDDAGEFSRGIRVTEPPTLCPCVVRITSQSSTDETTVPVDIAGVADVEPRVRQEVESIDRIIKVSGVGLEGSGPWTAWLGGGAERTLVFEVENVGDVAIDDPPLTLAVGKGDDPTGVVVAPELGSLEPGETRTYEVPVELDPLSFGEYTVTGRIDGLGEPVAFDARTTAYPWLLLLIPVVIVLQFLLIRGRNWLRSRIAEPEDEPEPAQLALPAAAEAVAAAPVAEGAAPVAEGDVEIDLVEAEAAEADQEPPVPSVPPESEPVPVIAQPPREGIDASADGAQDEEPVETPAARDEEPVETSVDASQEEADSYAAWIAALRGPDREPFGPDDSLESLESLAAIEADQAGVAESTPGPSPDAAAGAAAAESESSETEEEPAHVVDEPEPAPVASSRVARWSRVGEPGRATADAHLRRRESKSVAHPRRRDAPLESVTPLDEPSDSPAAHRRSPRSGGRPSNSGKWKRVEESAAR